MVSSISVIGLGKLGSPLVACFAARGFRVHAVDADSQKVEQIAHLLRQSRIKKTARRGKALLIDEFTRLFRKKVAFLATLAAQYNFRSGIRT